MDNIKSLKSLCIEPDNENKHFHCRETTQQKLINTSFVVLDYIDGVKTKFGGSRYIVKIRLDDGTEQKFFTNSQEIKYVLGKELRIRISAWLGWAMACDSKHLLKTTLKEDYENVLRPKACQGVSLEAGC